MFYFMYMYTFDMFGCIYSTTRSSRCHVPGCSLFLVDRDGRSGILIRWLSSWVFKLLTEHKVIFRKYFGRPLNILMDRHLKLLNARVPLRPTLTLLIVHDLPLRSERVAIIGWKKLGSSNTF